MHRTIFILLILLSGISARSQQNAGDSFLQHSKMAQDRGAYDSGMIYAREAIYSFTQSKHPDALGEAYVMLWSNMTLKKMPEQGRMDALNDAAEAFHAAGNKRREADCNKEMADILEEDNEYPQALFDLKKALQLYQSAGYAQLQSIYDLLGLAYVHLDDYKEGLRYGLLAEKTAGALNDTSMTLCTIYNSIGNTYMMTKEMDKAGLYFAKGMSIAEKYNDLPAISVMVSNTAELLDRTQRYKETIAFIDRKKRAHPLLEKDDEFRVYTDCTIAGAFMKLKQYDKAGIYCRGLEDDLAQGDLGDWYVARICKRLSLFYLETGNYQKASAYLDRFINSSKAMSSATFNADAHLLRFKIDSAEGHYISAIGDLQKYTTISDSLFDQVKSRQVNQLNVLYETEKKDKNIRLLEQQTELQQIHLNQAAILRNFILGAAALLLVIVFLLFKAYRTKQHTNKVLQQQQELIDQKNTSLQRLVTEKEWLLKEIHHRVKNNLHMVVGLLASQSEFIKGKEAYTAITESQHRIQAMSLIHQKLYQTESLSSTHMPSYILELVDYLKSSFDPQLPICFNLDIANIDFPLSHSIPIALILNEAIVNAIKYAFPGGRKGEISIALTTTSPQHFKMSIRDDGVGLPADLSLTDNASLGMTLMQGLSDDIGASFRMINNGGTWVELDFSFF
jgi:two-component sensor histidine kinase